MLPVQFKKISMYSPAYSLTTNGVDQWKTYAMATNLQKQKQSLYLATVEDAYRQRVAYDPDQVGPIENIMDRMVKCRDKCRPYNRNQKRGYKRRNTNEYFKTKAKRSRRSQRRSHRVN